MLHTLAVANYRSINSLILPLGRLNLITGANGSGKSTSTAPCACWRKPHKVAWSTRWRAKVGWSRVSGPGRRRFPDACAAVRSPYRAAHGRA